MTVLFKPLLLAAIVVAAAGCSDNAQPESEAVAVPEAGASAPPAPVDSASPATASIPSGVPSTATVGGDGSPIVLTQLRPHDFESTPIDGELACRFSSGEAEAPWLVARGNVADAEGRAQALARIGSETALLVALEPGRFDGMPDGARFGTKGMTFTVSLTGQAAISGGESPANPARLLLQRADGAERTIPGLWTCGP